MSHTQNASHAAPAEESDGIQVGFVAVLTCSFAAFLLVSLIGLEAFFYNASDAEEIKNYALVPQGGPTTDLGKANAEWNTMLHAHGTVPNIVAPGKEDPTGKSGSMLYPKVNVRPIDLAMDDIVNQFGKPETAPKGPNK